MHSVTYAAKLVNTRCRLSSTTSINPLSLINVGSGFHCLLFGLLFLSPIRSQFQVKPATLLIPIDPFFLSLRWTSFVVPASKAAPYL
jgi:hypothetical protein